MKVYSFPVSHSGDCVRLPEVLTNVFPEVYCVYASTQRKCNCEQIIINPLLHIKLFYLTHIIYWKSQ